MNEIWAWQFIGSTGAVLASVTCIVLEQCKMQGWQLLRSEIVTLRRCPQHEFQYAIAVQFRGMPFKSVV